MAKTPIQTRAIADTLAKKSKEFTFQDPALIEAPYTTITDLSGNARKLPDPSKTLKPTMGIERISFKSAQLLTKEKGPNGEQVFQIQSKDDRIRFINSWTFQASATEGSQAITSDSNSYVEVTFYGTGLNLLVRPENLLVGTAVSIDGGSENTVNITLQSLVIFNRNYQANTVFPIVSGLSQGTHTIKIRRTSNSLYIQGFEILNESTQIKVPQGEIYAQGNKFTNSALATLDYNTGFDGSPTLNGRGGRVVQYITPEGTLGKVIQQVDNAQANLTSADHSNEEVIRKINFREFGANRPDDFSTLAGAATARAFTLDDGTTTLVGNAVQYDADLGKVEGVRPESIGSFVTLTFVGTGLDLTIDTNAGTTYEYFVDGNSIGQEATVLTAGPIVKKIVSGLPYGTHTVKWATVGTPSGGTSFVDCTIYGPKKPSIPSGAQEIGEYYLMADFVANTTADINYLSTGVLRKANIREQVYVGAGWGVSSVVPSTYMTGFQLTTATNAEYVEYTFFGTGFDIRYQANTDGATAQITIDTLDANTTNFPSATFSEYGNGSFNSGTGVLTQTGTAQFGNGLVISGLSLGLHTVRMTKTGVTNLRFDGIDIITPIHYPNTKVGSLSMGPAVQLQKETSTGGVDLSKAKAWLKFDGTSELNNSHNISAVLRTATGHYVIYFEKPFKSDNYIVVGIGTRYGTGVGQANYPSIDETSDAVRPKADHCDIHVLVSGLAGQDDTFMVAFFGELVDEESE